MFQFPKLLFQKEVFYMDNNKDNTFPSEVIFLDYFYSDNKLGQQQKRI